MAKYTSEDLKGKTTSELRELCKANSIEFKDGTPAAVLKKLLLSFDEDKEELKEEIPVQEEVIEQEELVPEVTDEDKVHLNRNLRLELNKRRLSQNIGARTDVYSEVARRRSAAGGGSIKSLQEEIQNRKLKIKR